MNKSSQLHLQQEFLRALRNRRVDQKFLYLDEDGARMYYDAATSNKAHLQEQFSDKERCDLISPHLSKGSIAFISLGIGNAQQEVGLLKHLGKLGFNIDYYGVDLSKPMLKRAEESLKDVAITKHFIQNDFSNDQFIRDIIERTKNYDQRIITFIGFTICNVNQTSIADILFNIMKPNDLLWFDFLSRSEDSLESDLKLFNRYSEYLSDMKRSSFYTHPLKTNGIDPESGRMTLKVTKEPSVGALLFVFTFNLIDKVVSTIHEEVIHLLPEEEIEIQNIRVYRPSILRDFFFDHEFKLLNEQYKKHRGQFLFVK